MNGAEQHRKLTEKSIAIKNMKGQGYYRTAKDDNGWKKMVNLLFYCFFYSEARIKDSVNLTMAFIDSLRAVWNIDLNVKFNGIYRQTKIKHL